MGDYDAIVNGPLQELLDLGSQLGNDGLNKQLASVSTGFNAQRDFLKIVSECSQPSQLELQRMLKPILTAQSAAENGVTNDDFQNHTKAVAEAAGVLSWVLQGPNGKIFAKEMVAAALFHGNKVLREHKESSAPHVKFVQSLRALVEAVASYVETNHANGLAWNASGPAAKAGAAPPSPAPAPAAPGAPGAPPPPGPPPPGPPPPPAPAAGAAPEEESPHSQLFAQINAGGVTSGLKKVTDEMKTHKNPELRSAGVVPAKAAPKPAAAPAAAAPAKKAAKPPRVERQDKKWWIENQTGNTEIVLDETNAKQVVFISNCVDSVVQITGKVNQITIENSSKTGVVFDTVVSSLDVINSKKCKVQATGTVRSVLIDKAHEITLYLGAEYRDTVVTTSLSSDVNIVHPGANEDSDMVEEPVPYQFQTRFAEDGSLQTEQMRHE